MIELTEKVRKGEMDGKTVWICHYNKPDLNKKPLRNVPPTKCLVVSNDKLPKNKTVYYSKSHYLAIGKNGKTTARVISPVDNTGYRGYCGNMLFTFECESDCVEEWNKQIKLVTDRYINKIKTFEKELLEEVSKLNDMIFI